MEKTTDISEIQKRRKDYFEKAMKWPSYLTIEELEADMAEREEENRALAEDNTDTALSPSEVKKLKEMLSDPGVLRSLNNYELNDLPLNIDNLFMDAEK